MIRKTSAGRYHVKVEHNGVIGNAIKATPEAAFMAAAVERYETDRAFTRFASAVNRQSLLFESFPIIVEA